jgi:hypothetical protein
VIQNGMRPNPAGELLDQAPPSDPIAEANVLGAINLNAGLLDAYDIRAEHFGDQRHRIVLAHYGLLRENGKPIDAEHVYQSLQSTGDLERIGGAGTLAEIIQACVSPGRFSEYLRVLHDMAARRGALNLAIATIRAVHSREATPKLLDGLRDEAEFLIGECAGNTPRFFKPQPARELIAEHPRLHEPIIDGILRRQETANIIAAPKMGKSWLTYGLGLSVVTGGDWLGRYRCRQGRVLLIDNELHQATLANRLKTVAGALKLPASAYGDDLVIHSLRGRLTDLHGIALQLRRLVESDKFDLVILDAFYRTLPAGASENDNATVAGLYNVIDAIARDLQAAWVNVHHATKGGQAEKSVTDVGAGAGSQSRAADAHLILRQHEEDEAVVLEAVVRSFPPVEPIGLRWTFPLWESDDNLDPAQLRGKRTKGEERQNDRDTDAKNKLVAAIAKGPQTARQLRGVLGAGKERTERLLDSLESEGAIKWDTVEGNGGKQRVYTMKQGGL